jgi:hypothetical protein
MTKLTSTPAGAVLVAIDMSKNRQEVLIKRPEGGRRRRMTVMATRQDYDALPNSSLPSVAPSSSGSRRRVITIARWGRSTTAGCLGRRKGCGSGRLKRWPLPVVRLPS